MKERYTLGTRAEIKGINSFIFGVKAAIVYEIKDKLMFLNSGNKVIQEQKD
jgi:Asp-tRNA(Asn)/Glu-tRNA(Gln) amidotransferase B subunit